MASGTSSSDHVRSITGRTAPDAISPARNRRSSAFGRDVKLVSRWLTAGDSSRPASIRPRGAIQRPSPSPLIWTSVPSPVSARRQAAGDAVPATWRTRW